MTRHTYEIRVIGSLGPATREAFADLVVEVEPAITVLSGDLDQCGLRAVLERVRALGLELVEIKQAQPPALSPRFASPPGRLSSASSKPRRPAGSPATAPIRP